MPIYESIFIINPNISDEDTNAVIKKMQDVVVKQGGEILKFEDWGKKRLAYEVRKHKRGHYVFFQIKGEPAAIQELERNLKLTDSVIKYLTVKLVKELRTRPEPKPSAEAKKEEQPKPAAEGAA